MERDSLARGARCRAANAVPASARALAEFDSAERGVNLELATDSERVALEGRARFLQEGPRESCRTAHFRRQRRNQLK